MAKFHINPSTGDVSVCRSLQGKCPFGEAAHADTQEGARALYEKTMSVETVAVLKKAPSGSGVKGAVASGAQGIMGAYGSKSYSETIANAKERAGYASAYYDRKSDKSKATSRVLRGNSTLASTAVSERTRGALAAAPASVDFSRGESYTSPAVDNIEAVRSALSSRDASAVTSPIGAAAGNFTW